MSRLDVHVGGTFADTKGRVLDAVARAERGEVAGETHITFEAWEALAAVMTPKRFELVRHLHRSPEASVAALARSLGETTSACTRTWRRSSRPVWSSAPRRGSRPSTARFRPASR